jgi:hypothetical protein
LLDRRHVRTLPGASTIENRGATLVIGIVAFLCSGIGLNLHRGAINGVRDRNAIPDWSHDVGIVATVMMAVAIPMVAVVVAMVDPTTRDERGTSHRRETLGSQRRDTGRGTVDRTASKTRGCYRCGWPVDLS